jgi:hypothetical protein
MYPASIALKTRLSLQGTDTEKKLASVLFDESVQVLSSFELNQLASLSYSDMPCDEIFTILEDVMSHPLDHSVLCLQKSLVVCKHIVLVGSEKCVNSAWALGRYVESLTTFNTVLAAQERGQAWLQRFKGGSVDKGHNVREAAQELHSLLILPPDTLQLQRQVHADPNSLVPVGDDRVAFVSDEVRHFMLQKRMEEERLMRTKSNLAKERGGFGSGYNSKDGKNVVGAAHSVEEMLARAQREENRYTDDGKSKNKGPALDVFSVEMPASTSVAAGVTTDLLDFDHTAPAPAVTQPEVDLLDLSSEPVPVIPTNQRSDLLGADDLLAGAQNSSVATTNGGVSDAADLLSLMTVAPTSELLAPSSAMSGQSIPDVSSSENTMTSKTSVMSSNADRFAALDALQPAVGASKTGSVLSGKEAENRILGNIGVGSSTAAATSTTSSLDEPPLGQLNQHYEAGSDYEYPSSNGILSNTTPSSMMMMSPPVAPKVDYSSIHMGTTFGNPADGDEDEDDGFVMGGSKGSGLEPIGAAPAAPPPPPP